MSASSRGQQAASLPPISQSTPALNLPSPSASMPSFSTPTSSRSQKSTPTPLNVPPRSESLPFATTLLSNSPESLSPGRSDNSHHSGNPPSTKPLTIAPRKFDNPANINGAANAIVNTANANGDANRSGGGSSSSSSSFPHLSQTPPVQPTQTPPAHNPAMPHTAPPGFGFPDSVSNVGPVTHHPTGHVPQHSSQSSINTSSPNVSPANSFRGYVA